MINEPSMTYGENRAYDKGVEFGRSKATAEIERLHEIDRQKTREINILTMENRRLWKIVDDYAQHDRPACSDVPEADAKAGFCYCGLSHALKEARAPNSTAPQG